MARLQDFQTVTPTSSDNILIVQSQGQGLASVGSMFGSKMDKADPTGTGTLNLNRKANTTIGSYSSTIGYNNEASGSQSFAEGNGTIASGNQSHAEGYQTTASGLRSHVEGSNSTASGNRAHAEGDGTTSGGYASHSEGVLTNASGSYSHAEGNETVSSGQSSHAEGRGTEANHRSQHVFGEYNVTDPSTAAATSKGNYVEIVGNGSSSTPANARTLDWSGNETIAGSLTQSSDANLKNVSSEPIPDVSGIKAVRFTWKEDANRDEAEHVGYLAQDVEKVLPFLVKEDAEGHKALDYIAFLVAKVDSLEKRIAELEK